MFGGYLRVGMINSTEFSISRKLSLWAVKVGNQGLDLHILCKRDHESVGGHIPMEYMLITLIPLQFLTTVIYFSSFSSFLILVLVVTSSSDALCTTLLTT